MAAEYADGVVIGADCRTTAGYYYSLLKCSLNWLDF